MDDKELLHKIKDIVYAVPDELYKYKKPDDWDESDWISSSAVEKGFMLIRELIENEDVREYQKHKDKQHNSNNINVLNLGKGPRFWSQADENMFFNAIYSLASFIEIKGKGTELHLYYQGEMTTEEKKYLISLLKRYQMSIPEELKEVTSVN